MIKNYVDNRAVTDIGAAIFIKRSGEDKYSLWMPLTNIPATGGAPEEIKTTVTSARAETTTTGRTTTSQKNCNFFAHRDNFVILSNDNGKTLDFLQVNPDMTGWKFKGVVNFNQEEGQVGSALEGQVTITVKDRDVTPILNIMDIIKETVTFTSTITDYVEITGTGTAVVNVETDPTDAVVTVTSDTVGVATAAYESGKLTITGVASGSAIIKISASKADLATGVTHILVKVS